MTILEKKVDAIARSLLANDFTDRNCALGDLKVLMENKSPVYEDIEDAVRAALLELGVPDKLTGYSRLLCAISMEAAT